MLVTQTEKRDFQELKMLGLQFMLQLPQKIIHEFNKQEKRFLHYKDTLQIFFGEYVLEVYIPARESTVSYKEYYELSSIKNKSFIIRQYSRKNDTLEFYRSEKGYDFTLSTEKNKLFVASEKECTTRAITSSETIQNMFMFNEFVDSEYKDKKRLKSLFEYKL